jgi:hypothetical protein
MIKLILFILLLTGHFILFTSCKKCVTCKAYDRVDNSVKNQHDYCGPGPDISESEKNYVYIWNDSQTFADCK